MRLKARLWRLEGQVEWLDDAGKLRWCELVLKFFERKQQVIDKRPDLAVEWGLMPAPPEPKAVPPPPEPESRPPHPEEAAQRPSRRMGTSTASDPTLRDASLRDAPQGEVLLFKRARLGLVVHSRWIDSILWIDRANN